MKIPKPKTPLAAQRKALIGATATFFSTLAPALGSGAFEPVYSAAGALLTSAITYALVFWINNAEASAPK